MAERVTVIWHGLQQRIWWDFGGIAMGLVFFCLSYTPSLLPRGYVAQGVAAGLSFATGYGLGVALSYLYHHLPRWYRRVTPARKPSGIKTIKLSIISRAVPGEYPANSTRLGLLC
jgi:uncharacterized membrane protein